MAKWHLLLQLYQLLCIHLHLCSKKKKKKKIPLVLQTHMLSNNFDSFQVQATSCGFLSAGDTNCTLIGPEASEVKRESVKCYNLSSAQDLMPNRQMVRIILHNYRGKKTYQLYLHVTEKAIQPQLDMINWRSTFHSR